MSKYDYNDYIHAFTNDNGEVRFAVCVWDEKSGEYYLPMNDEERRLTGCSAYFAKTLEGIGGYKTRVKARYEAKKRFEL